MVRRLIASTAALLILSAPLAAGDAPRQQYLIRVCLKEQCAGQCKAAETTKVLAAPNVVTVEGRKVNYLVGGQKTVGGQSLNYGTGMNVRIHAAGSDSVSVQGVIEVSQVDDAAEDLVTRHSTSIHFHRTLELGKTAHFELPPVSSGNKQALEFSVEKVTGLPPGAIVSDDEPATTPRPIASGAKPVLR